jgi:hypothetical protein
MSTTSSLQWVGRCPSILMSVPKSDSASHTGALVLIRIQRCSPQSAASMGPISPLPAGMPMHACRKHPRMLLNSLRRTWVQRVSKCSSKVSHSTLSEGSSTHHFAPLNTHPSSSFHVAHNPFPCLSFLMETGSSPAWPVTAGGGKTEWMA